MFVMNLPLGTDATETRLLEYLIDRSRKKFWGIVHILTSRAPLGKRMTLLNKVVFGAMRWTIGAIFPTVQAQQMLNFFQVNCVRRMMGVKRGPQELWVDFEARSLRAARVMVHRVDAQRWGDVHVDAYWDFLGHRTREGVRECPSISGLLSRYRGLDWWQEQQTLSGGARHRRHYLHLMNCERRVAKTVGTAAWRDIAQDRSRWQAHKGKWGEMVKVPWASGRQLSLPG